MEKRSKVIAVRVTAKEERLIVQAVRATRRDRSDLLRRIVLEGCAQAKAAPFLYAKDERG